MTCKYILSQTEEYNRINSIYSLFRYDESGEIDEESSVNSDNRDWDQYWRILFKKVTLDDIKNFEKTYKNSEEEAKDLKN